MNPELPERDDLRAKAVELRAEAVDAMSLSRDRTIEITSARQLEIWESTARRILSLGTGDAALDAEATAMLEQAHAARGWVWVHRSSAVLLGLLALVISVGAAVLGGLTDTIAVAAAGGLAGSALLGMVVLRHRRQSWRIRAEQVAPLIWKPGV